MIEDNTRQSVLFPDLFSPPLRAQFYERHGSSDGGAILLKACAAALELSRRLAECLADRRHVGKVEHTVPDLLRQRLFGSAQCELFRLKSGGHPREHVSSLSKFWLALHYQSIDFGFDYGNR